MTSPDLAIPANQTQVAPGDPYLKVHLGQQTTAVFSMQHVQEAVVVSAQRLTSMPNVPACMLGLINRRSQVLWVIDLANLLQLQPAAAPTQQCNIVIIQVGSVLLGLAVSAIKGIVRLPTDSIQSPPGQVTAGLLPYLRGCALQPEGISLVLDAAVITQSPMLHSY
ncbi:MAG: purine-binding chemotaxis protein CheW [Cyanothece sp. SIO1E1]|nr:purine-binding chemotaxis protein CheW [Cyanothece sp. SIO1E1]